MMADRTFLNTLDPEGRERLSTMVRRARFSFTQAARRLSSECRPSGARPVLLWCESSPAKDGRKKASKIEQGNVRRCERLGFSQRSYLVITRGAVIGSLTREFKCRSRLESSGVRLAGHLTRCKYWSQCRSMPVGLGVSPCTLAAEAPREILTTAARVLATFVLAWCEQKRARRSRPKL